MGEKPRVLHVVTKMVVCGGASASVGLIAQRQNQSSSPFEVGIARGFPGPDEEELAPPDGTARFRIPHLTRQPTPLWDLRALREIRRTIRQFRPTVIHTHSAKAGILGRLAARMERVPVVVHHVRAWSFHHGCSPVRRLLYAALERHMARQTHALLFVGGPDVTIAQEARIGSAETWHVVRSGIDLSRFGPVTQERRQRAREALGLSNGAFVVGTVAQMRPQKAPLDFVQVAQRVRQSLDDSLFVWIGDGPMRAQVEAAVTEAGLHDRFCFAGSRRDVADLYPAFDVFLLTSLWEGLPRTVV